MILLMTTAPPSNGPWYLGKRLPPLGLAYIASTLEEAGFDVKILDNYLVKKSATEIRQTVEELKPEIVGITCGSATYRQCIENAKAIKDALPLCKIVAGGWHPSYVPESMLKHREIDYVVVGEGERAMVDLARAIIHDEKEEVIAKIPGVAFRHKSGISKTPPKFIDDLDDLPFPARHLLPMQLYDRSVEFLKARPADIMSVARGCPFNCAFCETRKLWGSTCRFFSPERIVREIAHLVKCYGTKGIYFINDNFTINSKHTKETCRLMLESHLDIEWACDTRVNMLSDGLLDIMSKAGCRTIWFGVESGSPRILKKLNRNTSLEQIEQGIKLCRKKGIQTACSFMMGVPGETLSDMEMSLSFAKKLNPDWCRFNVFIAYPDSTLYHEILQSGQYDQLDDFLFTVKTAEYDFKSLLSLQRRFQKEFNRNPTRLLRKLKREGPAVFLKQGLRTLFSEIDA